MQERSESCFLEDAAVSVLREGKSLTTCSPCEIIESVAPGSCKRALASVGARVIIYGIDNSVKGHTKFHPHLKRVSDTQVQFLFQGWVLDRIAFGFRRNIGSSGKLRTTSDI